MKTQYDPAGFPYSTNELEIGPVTIQVTDHNMKDIYQVELTKDCKYTCDCPYPEKDCPHRDVARRSLTHLFSSAVLRAVKKAQDDGEAILRYEGHDYKFKRI